MGQVPAVWKARATSLWHQVSVDVASEVRGVGMLGKVALSLSSEIQSTLPFERRPFILY